jgi:solute carrier family 39 (zinc transporter), member 1/2/3
MTVFTMFFIELMAARFDIFGSKAHDIEANDPSLDVMRQNEKSLDAPLIIRKGLSITLPFQSLG